MSINILSNDKLQFAIVLQYIFYFLWNILKLFYLLLFCTKERIRKIGACRVYRHHSKGQKTIWKSFCLKIINSFSIFMEYIIFYKNWNEYRNKDFEYLQHIFGNIWGLRKNNFFVEKFFKIQDIEMRKRINVGSKLMMKLSMKLLFS